jgi:3-methyladenine DNA glycosylase AlkD
MGFPFAEEYVGTQTTASQFIVRLRALRGPDATDLDDYHGVGMGQIFALAKECMDMSPDEIEQLLESPVHAVRVGAVSVMDFQARSKKVPAAQKRELFELYLRRHDRIDTWDLVDRSAIWVVGEYLVDKPRDVLDRLAGSDQPMERRTAILATFAFIRRGELDDAYRIAETLVDDPDDTVHKAVGWMLREAGKRDAARQAAFLEAHAATMPRVMLRYAIEKLDKPTRDRWLEAKGPAG